MAKDQLVGNSIISALFQKSSDGMIIFSDTIIDANEKALLLLESSADEIHNKSLLDFSPEYQPNGRSSKETLNNFLRENRINKNLKVWQFQLKNGSMFECAVSISEFSFKSNIYYLLHLITDGKNDLNDISNLHAFHFLQVFLDTLPDPLYYKNINGTYIGCNKAFEKMTALCRSEILGKTSDNIFDEDTAARLSEYEKEIIADETTKELEIQITLPDGSIHELFFHSTLYTDLNKKFNGIIGIIHDITRLKEIEQNLKKSEKLLIDANRSKDQFFSIIAHDLKAPFTGLLGFSEYMATSFEELDEDEIRDFSNRIYSSAKNAYSLLEDLLQWSRLKTDRLAFHPTELMLKEYTLHQVEKFAQEAAQKQIEIVETISENVYVFADSAILEDILTNLVSNAVKFTGEHGKISMSAQETGNFVMIEICDTGRGISEEDQKKLFRIDVNRSSIGSNKEFGTGLGLILCKEYVEKHGGTIQVESSPEKGSTFSFTLPKNEEHFKKYVSE